MRHCSRIKNLKNEVGEHRKINKELTERPNRLENMLMEVAKRQKIEDSDCFGNAEADDLSTTFPSRF